MKSGSPLRLLGMPRERNLALIVGSQTISSFGTGMGQIALAFGVLGVGGASDLGLVLLAREIPQVVFLLLGGIWADRVSRKWLLVAGDATMFGAQALTAVLFMSGRAATWNVAALQVLFGAAGAFTRPASTGLVPQAVLPEHLQRANALSRLGGSSTRVLGPALGGALVAVTNPGWALAVDAVTFLVSAALRAQLRIAAVVRPARKHLVDDLLEGWGEFKARTWVWVMVASFGLYQMTLFPTLLVLGPVVAEEHLGGAGPWGVILGFEAAGAIAGGLLALRLRPRRPLLMSTLLMVPTGVFLVTLGAAAPAWVLCFAGFLASACLMSGDILWQTTFQRWIPEHLLSRLSSFDWLGSIVLNPIGYALIGPFAGRIGVAECIYLAATINTGVSVAVALVPSVRNLHPEPRPVPELP